MILSNINALLDQWLEKNPRGHSRPMPFKSLSQDRVMISSFHMPVIMCINSTSCDNTWVPSIHWRSRGRKHPELWTNIGGPMSDKLYDVNNCTLYKTSGMLFCSWFKDRQKVFVQDVPLHMTNNADSYSVFHNLSFIPTGWIKVCVLCLIQ